MLSSTLFFNFVMAVIGSFQTFDIAYVISTARAGTLGGPAKATLFYMIYVYSLAFKGFNSMGYATALAWILFMIIFILTLIVATSNCGSITSQKGELTYGNDDDGTDPPLNPVRWWQSRRFDTLIHDLVVYTLLGV